MNSYNNPRNHWQSERKHAKYIKPIFRFIVCFTRILESSTCIVMLLIRNGTILIRCFLTKIYAFLARPSHNEISENDQLGSYVHVISFEVDKISVGEGPCFNGVIPAATVNCIVYRRQIPDPSVVSKIYTSNAFLFIFCRGKCPAY